VGQVGALVGRTGPDALEEVFEAGHHITMRPWPAA
jgi:hypothetical protein